MTYKDKFAAVITLIATVEGFSEEDARKRALNMNFRKLGDFDNVICQIFPIPTPEKRVVGGYSVIPA